MKILTRSQQMANKLPTTQIYNLLDDKLTLFVRPWGSQDYNQKLVDEITHYLSSAQADIDVTSPFDYHESLTSLANKTRIALLLAHDLFYKTENSTEFTVGFEVAVVFQVKNQLAWSSVGRFGLKKIIRGSANTIFESGADLDSEALLPVQMVGIEKEIEIQSGSLVFEGDLQLLLYSTYGGEIKIFPSVHGGPQSEPQIESQLPESTYWYSLIKSD